MWPITHPNLVVVVFSIELGCTAVATIDSVNKCKQFGKVVML